MVFPIDFIYRQKSIYYIFFLKFHDEIIVSVRFGNFTFVTNGINNTYQFPFRVFQRIFVFFFFSHPLRTINAPMSNIAAGNVLKINFFIAIKDQFICILRCIFGAYTQKPLFFVYFPCVLHSTNSLKTLYYSLIHKKREQATPSLSPLRH